MTKTGGDDLNSLAVLGENRKVVHCGELQRKCSAMSRRCSAMSRVCSATKDPLNPLPRKALRDVSRGDVVNSARGSRVYKAALKNYLFNLTNLFFLRHAHIHARKSLQTHDSLNPLRGKGLRAFLAHYTSLHLKAATIRSKTGILWGARVSGFDTNRRQFEHAGGLHYISLQRNCPTTPRNACGARVFGEFGGGRDPPQM